MKPSNQIPKEKLPFVLGKKKKTIGDPIIFPYSI